MNRAGRPATGACAVLLAAAACAAGPRAVAQVEAARTGVEDTKLEFSLDALSLASSVQGMSRLDVFLQIAYDELTFVKEGENYRGAYEVTLVLNDSAGRLAAERVWTEQVKPAGFEQAVSPRSYSMVQKIFDLPPGRYSIVCIVQDLETRQSRRLVRQIEVQRYDLPGVRLSDIMLVSKVAQTGGKRTIVPSVSSNLGLLKEPVSLFFESYADTAIPAVHYRISVLDAKKEKVLETDTLVSIPPGRTQTFLPLDHLTLALGEYALFVQAILPGREADGAGRTIAVTSRTFFVRWFGLPRGVKDLDLAIDQLQYIAEDTDLEVIRDGKTPEERQQRFFDFWKSRDPNPNTPRNERMEEYYERVDYANRHFTRYQDGWKTDMGMVFIIFGPPNNVDRHPFDLDAKPYEIWSYFEINYSFVFIDQTGFGDYRLSTPLWEVWQRRR